MNVLQRSLIASVGIAALLAPAAGAVEADATADHLQCFDIKDDLKLKAIADLDSRQLGLDPNCTIGKAKLFCIPATKKVLDIPTLAHMTGPDAGDRICYEAQCKTPSTALPASTLEADQFGARSLIMTKTQLLCTPAVKVLPGFLGRTEITTDIPGYEGDQFWTDSDGVDPAVPGCHFPFSDGKCTASLAPAGVFGEFCNPPEGSDGHQAGFPEGALIATPPPACAISTRTDSAIPTSMTATPTARARTHGSIPESACPTSAMPTPRSLARAARAHCRRDDIEAALRTNTAGIGERRCRAPSSITAFPSSSRRAARLVVVRG